MWMDRLKITYNKWCAYWTTRRLAIVFVMLHIVTLLPILYCSFYDYATGDDLGYSAAVHQLMQQGAPFSAILQAIWGQVVTSWYNFQGTWSSIILFQLQPGIWGERVYAITPWIALACIIGGTGYILHDLLVLRLHYERASYWAILSVLLILSVQYMPRIRGGIFWYTSVAHYIIPYCVSLLSITWAVKWMDHGQKRYPILMLLGMIYLGGAGYPPIVMAAAVLLILMLISLCRDVIKVTLLAQRRRALVIAIPLGLEVIGFGISAMAPGNKVRGGSDFGFSAQRAIGTIAAVLRDEISIGLGYVITDRLLVPGMLIIAVLAFEAYDIDRHRVNARYPLGVAVVGYLLTAAVRAPEIYAGVEVSGGVPDVDYLVYQLCLTGAICYCMVWLKNWLDDHGYAIARDAVRFNRCVRTPIMIAVMLFCIVFYRHYIGGTADYTCITFIQSGALADYQEQMQERLAILENDSIQDVVLPEMNEYQGPFMHMPLMRDHNSFTNYVTEKYYGKRSVIAIPREEYEAHYRDGIRINP